MDSWLAFKHPGLAPPGAVTPDLTGPVLWQVLEDVRVDRAEVVKIEGTADRLLDELRNAVLDKKRFALVIS